MAFDLATMTPEHLTLIAEQLRMMARDKKRRYSDLDGRDLCMVAEMLDRAHQSLMDMDNPPDNFRA